MVSDQGHGSTLVVLFCHCKESSKNDSYCWVCHDGGDVLCCDKCPRVFHVQCSGLSKAPEGDEDWYCPVCKVCLLLDTNIYMYIMYIHLHVHVCMSIQPAL